MRTESKIIKYEDAAEFVNVTYSGWQCKNCKKIYSAKKSGTNAQAEHHAKWCCATDLPCEECSGRRNSKTYTCCLSCQEKHKLERWLKRPKKSYNGEMLYSEVTEKYYNDIEDVCEDFEDIENNMEDTELPGKLDDFRLVLCEPNFGREFDITQYLEDSLPSEEDFDFKDDKVKEINKIVNNWLAEYGPFSYYPGKFALDCKDIQRKERVNTPFMIICIDENNYVQFDKI